MNTVKIYDTTLRDGSQAEGIPLPSKIKFELHTNSMKLESIILKAAGRGLTRVI